MRRFSRHPTDIPIAINVLKEPKNPKGAIKNVSRGGLACEVDDQMKVGSQVEVDISSVSPSYHGSAEVIWCRPLADHYEVGIEFTSNEEAFKSRMVQQVCQIEHYKNMVFEREGRLLDTNEAAAEWIEKFASEF